jgi:chromosomal replication initiator protein
MATNPQATARVSSLFLGGGDDAKRAWEAIRAVLRAEFGQRTFDSWLKPIELIGIEDGEATLALPTHFMADWIRNHFLERLRGLWTAQVPAVRSIRLIVQPAIRDRAAEPDASTGSPAVEAVVAAPPQVDAIGLRLEDRYTFDAFVVGKSNELAYNAARTVAEGGPVGFNPLFLHGTTGLGKTHLMHAIGWELRARNPQAKVAYMSAEKFMVEFLAALRAKETIAFKQRLRSVDLLMIDDVQFISGKDSTQEEFFHTMNEIISAGKRLVITADRSPQSLEGIQERILSRLAWGLVADINPADYELRLNILMSKIERLPGVRVEPEVIEFLARRITSNVRELEGALNRVVAYATLVGKPVDLDFTRQVLADVLRAHEKKITIDEIQRKVADYYTVKLSDMMSARRAREVARPRQVAMYLAKKLTPRSLPEIGRRFGGRDHTTVMHAVKRIDELRAADRELDGDISHLSRLLDS